MKKIIAFILVLPLALSLCACSRASQIPSLAEIAENGAEWGGEQIQQVQGCTLADLEKAWDKADGELPGEYAYFWKVDDTTLVNVYYHKNAEIERITVRDLQDGDSTDGTGTTFIEQPNYHIENIVDRTKSEGLPYDMAEEKFFEDSDNEYYFSGIYSHYVIVHYEDGSQEDVVTALNAGRATIADLDKFEVSYIVKPLSPVIPQK